MTRLKTKRRRLAKKLPESKILILLTLLAVTGLVAAGWFWMSQPGEIQSIGQQPTSSQQKNDSKQPQQTPSVFDKTKYSLSDPASPWAVVNKGRQLLSGYVPADLTVPDVALRYSSGGPEMMARSEAAEALAEMFAAADTEGLSLMLASGYRSYATQTVIYGRNVRDYGQKQADRVSARPGHSEHQTGWAVDIEPSSRVCEIDKCFGGLPEGRWLVANAHRFGFIIRYSQGKENLTGYDYEPWHVRYVGKDLAGQIHASGMTLEQFMDLPYFTDYPAQPYQLSL